MPNTEPELLHIAVGVLRDERGLFLLSRRLPGKHLEGFWEFPGGKVKPGEAVEAALARELREEIGVEVIAAHSWLGVSHQYSQVRVFLDVWQVSKWSGRAHGREGQEICWVSAADSSHLQLPEADAPIVAGCLEL